jgi:ketosteroid isomerase-like protein
MSQENVEMIEGMYRDARDDPGALAAIIDDDAEFVVPDRYLGGQRYRGPGGVLAFFRDWAGTFAEWDYSVEGLRDAGDVVIAHVHQWGRGKASGATVDNRFWQVWVVKAGKVVRVTHHESEAEALEAVGLSE